MCNNEILSIDKVEDMSLTTPCLEFVISLEPNASSVIKKNRMTRIILCPASIALQEKLVNLERTSLVVNPKKYLSFVFSNLRLCLLSYT